MYSIFWKKSRNTWITSIIFPGGFSVVVGKLQAEIRKD